MKVELVHGASYRAVVNASIGSQIGLKLLHLKLTGSGFSNIKIVSLRQGVEITGVYNGPDISVELDQDIKVIQRTA
jgi:hypothetical protein